MVMSVTLGYPAEDFWWVAHRRGRPLRM